MRKELPFDTVIEFKPKWLSQSPSAPPSARRCRNCAREAYQLNKTGVKPTYETQIICPLDLLDCSRDLHALRRVLSLLAADATEDPDHAQHLAHWLTNNTLLTRLRDAQVSRDSVGPLTSPPGNEAQLALAMTLRDCTCFIRIRTEKKGPGAAEGVTVEAKLADLDRKNAAAKMGYWQKTERQLAEEGYYHGTERPRQATDCRLERS
jgi:inositol-pentakisphosphate 2-kinase